MARAADETLLGRVIAGKYTVESLIGGGAMGSVYRARQRDIDKAVAIKVLHRELLAEPLFAARFKREAKAASRLDHPNSMRVLDFGEEPDGLCFIVMELLLGRNLFQILKAEAPLSRERIVDILRQTLAALAVAHDMGVVHRDLKPENIIVVPSTNDEGDVREVVKVCDFGMAKISASRLEDEEHASEKLTSHGVVVGTPEYMSPEQGKGEPLDGRSDLYSVGVVLYQLLTGRLPFTAESAVGVLLKHLIEEPIAPSQLVPGVDPHLESVALRAMRKRPDERFASAREMRAALTSARALTAAASDRNVGADVPAALSSRSLLARGSSKPRLGASEAHAIGEAPTVEVQLHAPPTMTGLASVDAPARSLRLARDILSDPPPARRRSVVPFLAGVAVLGGVAYAAISGRVPGLAFDSLTAPARATATASLTSPSPSPSTFTSPSTAPVASSAVETAAAPPEAGAPEMPGLAATAVGPAGSAGLRPPAVEPGGRVPLHPDPSASDSGIAPGSSAAVPVGPAGSGAPSAPATTDAGYESAQVLLGAITANRASQADVLVALPVDRFTACYRDAMRASGRAVRGSATLHLDVDPDGQIGKASFEGTEPLREVGNCIVHAALGRKVKNLAPAGPGADAEVPLSFKVE
jgi:serine/threonine-protein kinase